MNKTMKFLTAFKKLEEKLKKVAQAPADHTHFREIIAKAKDKNPLIALKEGMIWDLYGLRNVFAHKDRDKYIAEVNALAMDETTKLLELLEHPPTVGQSFRTDMYIASLDTMTETVLRTMKEELYTHVPVYEDEKFIGVLTETTVLDWLVEKINAGKANFDKQFVRDIKRAYLHSPTNKFEFVAEDRSVFDVLKLFEDSMLAGERLGAVFVTTDGKKDRRPIGIITAWDLPRIKEHLM